MRERIHWNSVSLALGKPASISLKPHLRRLRASEGVGQALGVEAERERERGWAHRSNTRFFWASVMGLTRAWLPSRRSDEAQRGAFVMRLSGHVRSGRLTEAKGLSGAR